MFICDRTLGKLAKWLRILGFETKYIKIYDDIELLEEVAKTKGFIFLSRNVKILKNIDPLKSYLVKSDSYKDQLREISKFFPPEWSKKLCTLCSVCGSRLQSIDKKEVKHLLPEYVFDHYDNFKYCSSCSKVYWKGTHLNKIIDEIIRIFPGKLSDSMRE